MNSVTILVLSLKVLLWLLDIGGAWSLTISMHFDFQIMYLLITYSKWCKIPRPINLVSETSIFLVGLGKWEHIAVSLSWNPIGTYPLGALLSGNVESGILCLTHSTPCLTHSSRVPVKRTRWRDSIVDRPNINPNWFLEIDTFLFTLFSTTLS